MVDPSGPGRPSAGAFVARALRLVRQLAATDKPATLSHLARVTGLPKSSTHRALAVLAAEGVVSRTGNEHRLNPEWSRLLYANRLARGQWLGRMLTPFVVDLHIRTGLCAELVWWVDDEVSVLVSAYGYGDPCIVNGETELLFAGHVAARKLFSALRPSRGAEDASFAVRREMAHIRSTGLAVCTSEPVPWATSLAALVQVNCDHPPVALSLTGASEQVESWFTGTLLRQVAYAATVRLRQADDQRVRVSTGGLKAG